MRPGNREEVKPDRSRKYVSAGAIHLQTLQISPATPPGCGALRAPAPRPCWRLRRARRATTSPSPRASPVPTTRSTPCQSRSPQPPLTSVLAALPGRTKIFHCIAADNLKVRTYLTNIVIFIGPTSAAGAVQPSYQRKDLRLPSHRRLNQRWMIPWFGRTCFRLAHHRAKLVE